MLERVLLSSISLPASTLLTWALMPFVGVQGAPITFCFLFWIAIRLTIMPTLSSESASSQSSKKEPVFVCGSIVTALHVVLFLALPALVYVAINYAQFRSDPVFSFSNLLLLVFLPVVLLMGLTKNDVTEFGILWFLGMEKKALEQFESTLRLFALFGLAACLEHRIIIHGYLSRLAFSSTLPLLTIALVTIALFGSLSVCFLGYSVLSDNGLMHQEEKRNKTRGVRILLHAAAICIGLLLGFPWFLIPGLMVTFLCVCVAPELVCSQFPAH